MFHEEGQQLEIHAIPADMIERAKAEPKEAWRVHELEEAMRRRTWESLHSFHVKPGFWMSGVSYVRNDI
jgi:hypothetical protein